MSASDLAIKREIIRKELKLAAAHPYSEERLAAERTLRVQDSITGPIVGVRYVGLTLPWEAPKFDRKVTENLTTSLLPIHEKEKFGKCKMPGYTGFVPTQRFVDALPFTEASRQANLKSGAINARTQELTAVQYGTQMGKSAVAGIPNRSKRPSSRAESVASTTVSERERRSAPPLEPSRATALASEKASVASTAGTRAFKAPPTAGMGSHKVNQIRHPTLQKFEAKNAPPLYGVMARVDPAFI